MMLILQMTTEDIPKIDEINKLCKNGSWREKSGISARYSMTNLVLITVASLLNMGFGKMEIYKKRNELKKRIEGEKSRFVRSEKVVRPHP